MKRVLIYFVVFVAAYGAICAWTFVKQRSFIYFPRAFPSSAVEYSAKAAGLEPWSGRDGTRFGWKIADPENPTHAFVCFHGNGGLAVEETLIADKLRKSHPHASVCLLEYPGYADMPGEPSEKSIVDLASRAIEDLAAKSSLPIYLVGQSLGTVVACEAGTLQKSTIFCLLLITPFDSIASVAAGRKPYLPVNLLLRERFDSALHLRSFDRPVAVIVAEKDTVIPPKFGIALYSGYSGPKKMVVLPDAGHNDAVSLLDDATLAELLDFLQHPTPQPAPSVVLRSAP